MDGLAEDLVRRLRPGDLFIVEAETAMNTAVRCYREEEYSDPMAWFVDKFGKKRGEELYNQAVRQNTAYRTYECEICAVFTDAQFYYKRIKRYRTNLFRLNRRANTKDCRFH